ncbi:probable prolyl 4-hydroxylase 9 isoform X2 [Macadamia integrifolia]|uniref:probable prolyl 4-hydroxylase 9 isoform X2 n=1 Tax=Macadamia integrifolia TaxID=60698 RepID=UPI001C4EFB11|nr:probable prolyl 4-hydroxylase 9 isoform X2 [Macadamia integrifolia]
MKNKGKGLWGPGTKLGLPAVFLSCIVFFLVGLFGSMLRIQDVSGLRRSRLLESVDKMTDYSPMPHGETGETSVASMPFQVLSWKPRALYFPKFATAEQCKSIIKMAKANLEPSTLALREGETVENTKGIRTSSGTFISASEDKTGILDTIEQKIARVTMLPRSQGEAFNVLRYEIGQGYHSHYDAFNPAEYGPQKSHRVATFLLYLSNVKEGGETMFPYENDFVDFNYDYKKCIGLKVKPRQGDGILFYSLFTNGTIDPHWVHNSCRHHFMGAVQ